MNLNCTCLSLSHVPTIKCIKIMVLRWLGEIRTEARYSGRLTQLTLPYVTPSVSQLPVNHHSALMKEVK